MIEAAQESLAAVAEGAQLVLEECQPGRLAAQPGLLAGARFHGGITTSLTPADERFMEETDLLVPMVAFQRRLERHPYVDVDNVAGGAGAVRRLLDMPEAERPDAVFALSDVLAVRAMHAIRQAGLRVPQDVAVVGYDDLSYVAYLAPPSPASGCHTGRWAGRP